MHEEVGEASVGVGDAIDDIAGIAEDLDEVVNRWDNSVDDALWGMKLSFGVHWEEHLRNLQLYLCKRRIEGRSAV